MRKLLFILLFFCVKAGAQDTSTYTLMKGNYKFNNVVVKGNLWIPADTTNYKTGIARIGTVVYAGNGTKWTAQAGLSSSGVDSVRIKSVPYIDSVFEYKSGTRVLIGTIYKSDGKKSGGEVSRISGNDYQVTAAYFTIAGTDYNTVSDTVTLNAYSDSAMVAAIVANNSENVVVKYGAKSSNPLFPDIVRDEEILLSWVLISDTGNVIYTPSVDSNWVRDGDNLLNANPGNVILNDIYFIDGGTQKRIFSSSSQLWLQSNRTTGSKILLGTVGGNSSVSTNEVEISGGDNSGASGTKSALTISGRLLNASGTEAYSFINSAPTINKTGGTGDISFIKYNPTLTSVTGNHYFLNSSAGLVKFGGTPSVSDTTDKPVVMDGSGNLKRLSFWPTGSGGGGGTPNLDQVTTSGNTTSNAATFGSLTGSTLESSTSLSVGTSASIGTNISAQSAYIDWRVSTDTLNLNNIQLLGDSRLTIATASGIVDIISPDAGWTAQLDAIDITGTKNFKFQDKSGTLAFLSDISDSTKNFYVYSPLVVRDTTDGYVVEIDPDSLAAWRPVSGTYFPEFTEVFNIDSLYDSYKFFYSRNGDIVTVSGYMFLVTGSAGDQGVFTIELPIPSNLTDSDDINGICTTSNPSVTGGFYVTYDSLNPGVVTVGFSTLSSGDDLPINIIFTYIIK